MGGLAKKPIKFAKKHPWEAAGIAAALATGGAGLAGMGPMAGLLGGEAAAAAGAGAAGAGLGAAEAGSALAGASGLTDLAGATGSALAGTPSVSSPLLSGTQLSGLKTGLGNMGKAQAAMGLLNQPAPGGGAAAPPPPAPPIANTVLYPHGVGSPGASEDERVKRILAMMMRQQQGAA